MTSIAAGETKPSPCCTTPEPQKQQRKYLPQAGDESRDAAQESLSFLLLPFFSQQAAFSGNLGPRLSLQS